MTIKGSLIPFLGIMALIGGAGAGIVGIASAQSASSSISGAGVSGTMRHHGHMPLGNDGIISNITGSTITIGEEVDEGGASYTVNVGSATITKAGVAATIADLKVGDKVFVQGAVTGNTVQATSISDGPHGGFGGHDNDKEGIDLPEAGDTPDAPGAGN